MLIKDQLKYTVRGDKVFPKYVKPSDVDALGYAQFLVGIYASAAGQKQLTLSERVRQHSKSSSLVFCGLNKLLEDRCEYLDSEGSIESLRWDAFSKAKDIRNSFVRSIEDFQSLLGKELGYDFSLLESRIYGDLPEFRVVKMFDPIEAIDLIHRYNASQIQGLILRSRTLCLKIKDRDPIKRRRFLQRLKFWRLLAEIDEGKDELKIDLSGPLAMFDKSSTYGRRLSNFFPNVLLMDKWEITAEIKIDDKIMTLETDSSKSIKSHYGSLKGYIPAEFKDFIKIFNDLPLEEREGFVASEGEDVLNLGAQNYVVPDMTFQNAEGKRIHLELFHKWHESQLKQRVEALQLGPAVNLVLGVAAELLSREELRETTSYSSHSDLKIFVFKRFPTPKAIMAYLS